MTLSAPRHALWLAAAALLAGCASAPPEQAEQAVPGQWRAPLQAGQASVPTDSAALPHAGDVEQLLDWWRRWNDPLLADLISAAQEASPTLASAAARIAQARAGVAGVQSAMLPNVDAQAGAQRGTATDAPFAGQLVNVGQVGLQMQWELDLFGGLRHAGRAAQARLAGAQAQWHDARVSLAADTANQYFALRACQRNLHLAQQDATSREDTARLTGQLAKAGFAAPATLALAQAGAAQAQAQRNQTEAQCTAATKALAALTALNEDTLRTRLAQGAPGSPPSLAVDAVPAQVIGQRPDVFAAAQTVAAASGDVGQADAQRYPRLGLSGNITRAQISTPHVDAYSTTWTVGPLAISLPLFDGGRRKANLESARAQYEAAASQYRASVRNAVREVETALVNLHSAQQRSSDTALSVRGFEKNFAAANAKYKAGMGSMLELEDARRNLLAAQMGQIGLQQQTWNAWVALYRALGGGWQPATNPTEADRALVAAGEQQRKATPTAAPAADTLAATPASPTPPTLAMPQAAASAP